MPDLLTLLDQIRTIAQNGLTYAESPYDRERYTKLLALATQEYAAVLGEPAESVRQRFRAETGYITPKVGADAAIFNAQGEILLHLRADDKKWCLPCGWVDPNEHPAQTAVRETREETGLEVRITHLVDVMLRPPGAEWGPHSALAVIYLAEITGGAIQVSHEGLEIRWWRIDEVPAWHTRHEDYARAAFAKWDELRQRA